MQSALCVVLFRAHTVGGRDKQSSLLDQTESYIDNEEL